MINNLLNTKNDLISMFEYLPWFWVLMCVSLGAVVGSFSGLVAYRLPFLFDDDKVKSNLWGRSHCDSCREKLNFIDLIPIAGWLIRGGKCYSCRGKVSYIYPFMEFLTGVLFGFEGYHWGPTYTALFVMISTAIILCAAWIDWKTYWLPDRFTFILIILGLLGSPFVDSHSQRIWGMFIPGFVMFVSFYAMTVITKKDSMSMGDVFMVAGSGAILGADSCFAIIMLSAFIFVIYSIPLRMMKIAPNHHQTLMLGELNDSEKSATPMGPAIGIATVILMFNQNILISPVSSILGL